MSHSVRSLVWITAAASLAAAGCSHEQDGPEPKPAGSPAVTPQATCTAQDPVKEITLKGEGLSPEPQKTLEDSPQLVLPRVELLRIKDIAGTATSDGAKVIPDDAASPKDSKLRWVSQQEMRLLLGKSLSLGTGLYNLRVTNPNGKQATWKDDDALLVVPPPKLTSIKPGVLCAVKATDLTIVGDFLLKKGNTLPTVTATPSSGTAVKLTPVLSDCRDLPGPSGYQACKKITISVPPGTLDPGSYSIAVAHPSEVGCKTTETLKLTVVAKPEISDVKPTQVCVGGGTLTITGKDFYSGAKVDINKVQATKVTVNSKTSITASWNSGVLTVGGPYDVTVDNGGGCTDTIKAKVTVKPGPQIFFVDPPVVYNGISTQVTIYGSGFTGTPKKVSLRPTTGSDIDLKFTFDSAKARIQATIPSATKAGTYDMVVTDPGDCPAVLQDAVKVVDKKTLTITKIDPPFGHTASSTAVTVTADSSKNGGFKEVPRLYLNPTSGGTGVLASLITSVAFNSATTVTGVVPSGLKVGKYDVIAVNPNGDVGVLDGGFTVTTNAPPDLTNISPGSIANKSAQSVKITGTGFDQSPLPKVTLRCLDPSTGNLLTTAPSVAVNGSTGTSLDVVVNASTASNGAVCVVRVTNADGSYGELSALVITNPAQKLSTFKAGPTMATARKALAAVGNQATKAARFVYAMGGEDASGKVIANTKGSVEVAPVDIFGRPSKFFTQQNELETARSWTQAATIGRCLYLAGGTTGGASGVLDTVERACVLDPDDAPEISDLNLTAVKSGGLAKGLYYYRVSAVMPSSDPKNPGGETLPSDPFPLLLPKLSANRTITVKLFWSKVANATGYKIYRSPKAGDGVDKLQLIKSITSGSTTAYTDKNDTPVTPAKTPLKLGATGTWHAITPKLKTARRGAGVAILADPQDTTGTKYVLLVAGGRSSSQALGSIERLSITIDPKTDAQTVGAAFSVVPQTLSKARWQVAAFGANNANASAIPAPKQYLYVGAGVATNGNTGVRDVDAFEVLAGGGLGSRISVDAMSPSRAGYGAVVANSFLYAFGGQGGQPSDSASQAKICTAGASGCTTAAPPNLQNWSTATKMSKLRYLMGSAIQSGFIYLLGGAVTTSTVTNSTEYTIW